MKNKELIKLKFSNIILIFYFNNAKELFINIHKYLN